ncbi:MAG: hypothetical protein KC457_01620 [Myxococcales bacterium]|nr:hypothetical protein [Myxococcales bacterium]
MAFTFKLAKLQVVAYRDSKRKKPVKVFEELSTFEAMYNPSSFTLEYKSEFQKAAGLGAGTKPARFIRSGPKVLALKLIFDGTRVGLTPIQYLWHPETVSSQVDGFIDLCFRRNGEIHEPTYLRVSWGEGPLQSGFDCRLESAKVNYTSFDRDGAPLRAELDVTFVEDLHPPKAKAESRLSSPDLTHVRVVKAGDTLPLLCAEIYGSSQHYLRVAEFNGLDDFRALVPGTELSFPPLEKRGGKRKGGS